MKQNMFGRHRYVVTAEFALSCGILIASAAAWAGSAHDIQSCPPTPNCVSSNPATDADHSIAPLRIAGSPHEAWNGLKKVLLSQERTLIVKDADAYIHAESRSLIFGFVDDVEFQLDAEKAVIHVRSASRVGYWDFGVNRRRVEVLREQLSTLGAGL